MRRALGVFLGCLLSLATVSVQAQEEPPAVVDIETGVRMGPAPILEDNARKRLLGIRSFSGSFQLEKPAISIGLRVDFYRNGQKLPLKTKQPGVGGRARQFGQFDVEIVDLDRLPLGGEPAGHWKFFLSVMPTDTADGRGVIGMGEFEVPKAIFDAQPRTSGAGLFEDLTPQEDGAIALFYQCSGRVQKAASLAEVLKQNPESDILVVLIVPR